MEEKQTLSDGTEITRKRPDVVPDTDNPCQAIVTTQIAICEPMSDGSWRLLTSFNDNYNIVLEGRDEDEAIKEVVSRLNEVKKRWEDKNLIISLENLLTSEKKQNFKMEEKQ